MNTVTKIGEKVDIIKKGGSVESPKHERGGRLNQKPVIEEYSKLASHLVSHVTDPSEPLDKKDVIQSMDLIDKISKIKGKGLVQSVVFRKPKWSIDTAKEWLDKHGYIYPKVDEQPNTLRFRQHEPSETARYITKPLGRSGILLVIGYDKIKSHKNVSKMPHKQKITMMGQGLEGNAGIGGKGLGQDMGYDSDSSVDSEEGGGGLYASGRGMGAGMGAGVHIHHHYHVGVPEEMEGKGINWKKVGRTLKKTFTPVGKEIVKVAKPIVKEISHKYLPKLAGEAGAALGMAGADFLGQPELASASADLGSKLGTQLGSAADKKIQGLGIRRGRFEKGSPEAIAWGKAMREKRGKK